jgi:hypothetical protein
MSIGPLIADEGQAFFASLAVHDFGVRPHDSTRRAELAGLRSAASAVAKSGWRSPKLMSFIFLLPDAGGTVLSEVDKRLMMIFGAGASTCATKCGNAAFSRLTEVAQPPSRRGHRRRNSARR